MPNNPTRKAQGGDVNGTTRIDVTQGTAIEVASASFDPGYDIETTLKAGDSSKADLVKGYCSYGRSIGES